MAGHADVHRSIVAAVSRLHGSDDAVTVGSTSHLRHLLANLNTRNAGRDRKKGSTNILGSVWLQIPHILLRSATILQDEDAGPFILGRVTVWAANLCLQQ
jgi:hypothetical protein